MAKTFTFDTAILRGEDEFPVRVTYSAAPIIPQTYWQPAEGGEIELHSLFSIPDITEAEEELLVDECAMRSTLDLADEAADHADYLYEQQRDRRLEEWR